MLNKVLDVLDDFDFERVTQTVDMVWDDREKILGSVNLVWDNRDDIMDVVGYVMSHRDMIGTLLDKLPELLSKTGDYIESAGQSAVRASEFLTGADGEEGLSIRDLTELAAKALERCEEELKDVAQFINNLGDKVDGITIPSFEPTYSEIMGFNVISGIEFGESNLIDDAGEQLQKGSQRLAEIGKEFQAVAGHMRTLGGSVTSAGGDLNQVGSQLSQSGDLLRGILGMGLSSAPANSHAINKASANKTPATLPATGANLPNSPKAPTPKRKVLAAAKAPIKKGTRLSQLKGAI